MNKITKISAKMTRAKIKKCTAKVLSISDEELVGIVLFRKSKVELHIITIETRLSHGFLEAEAWAKENVGTSNCRSWKVITTVRV